MGTGYATLGPDATNNSIATAFDISNNFSLASDPDIFNSTTILHSTVNATGNGHGGYYKVDLAAGTVITIDIDGIADPDVHDSWVRLLDSAGNIVAENDDGGGDPGSDDHPGFEPGLRRPGDRNLLHPGRQLVGRRRRATAGRKPCRRARHTR